MQSLGEWDTLKSCSSRYRSLPLREPAAASLRNILDAKWQVMTVAQTGASGGVEQDNRRAQKDGSAQAAK